MTWPNEDELCHFVPALYPTERIKRPAGRLLAALRRGDPDQEKNQEKNMVAYRAQDGRFSGLVVRYMQPNLGSLGQTRHITADELI